MPVFSSGYSWWNWKLVLTAWNISKVTVLTIPPAVLLSQGTWTKQTYGHFSHYARLANLGMP